MFIPRVIHPSRDGTESLTAKEPTKRQIDEQLDRIIRSSLFRNSKRYPALLQYIVLEAVTGRTDGLKERLLGMQVFGRPADYDTNSDPIVRITAGEVRKRIAQYYKSPGCEHELRIEIPLGSYAPRFYWISDTELMEQPEAADECGTQSNAIDASAIIEGETAPSVEVSKSVAILSETAPVATLALPVSDPPATGAHRALRGSYRTALFAALIAAVTVGATLAWSKLYTPPMPSGRALFWNNVLRSPEPTLIVLGVHSFDSGGNDISAQSHADLPQNKQTLLSAMTQSDMVQLSDAKSYAQITTLLAHQSHPFRTQGAADTTLDQLRQGPFVLIGGFNNIWTKRLSQELRYRLVTLNGRDNVIMDSQHPLTMWAMDVTQSALSNSRDYSLVSCFRDPETDQNVIIAAGLGSSGTEAAADFITRAESADDALKMASGRQNCNLEIVLETDVIEGKPGQSHVVASYRW